MKSLKTVKPTKDNAVYLFILKKENEGKGSITAKIAGLNKFLRIYYARVMEVYNNLKIHNYLIIILGVRGNFALFYIFLINLIFYQKILDLC